MRKMVATLLEVEVPNAKALDFVKVPAYKIIICNKTQFQKVITNVSKKIIYLQLSRSKILIPMPDMLCLRNYFPSIA